MPFCCCSLPGGGENRCCYHRFPQATAGADHVDPPGAERGAHRGVRGHRGRQSRRPEGTRGTNFSKKPSCQGFADPRCRLFSCLSSGGGATKVYLGEIAMFLGSGSAWRLAVPFRGSFSLPASLKRSRFFRQRILEGAEQNPLPAARVQPHTGQLHWFLDEAAAAELSIPLEKHSVL